MDTTQWEEALKKELKTDQIERFLRRPLLEGFESELLSLQSKSWASPAADAPALSHTWVDEEKNLAQKVPGLMALGVWDFIVDRELLGLSEVEMQKELAQLTQAEARFWVVGNWRQALPANQVPMLCAGQVWGQGGHAVHEMAWLLNEIIAWAQSSQSGQLAVGLYADREFFKSIAKFRAMKAITLAALRELKQENRFTQIVWCARSSWREFTAYDAASNILRNATALSAGFISNAQVVESLPYDLLIESSSIVSERAARLALTSQLVLQQESGLGEVADAASGSHALENLTRALGEKAWELMQELQGASDPMELLSPLLKAQWEKTQALFHKRKLVQTGVNDFPEATEVVQLKKRFQKDDHHRLAEDFEKLRLRAQALKVKPTIAVAVIGDYAGLNARLSFTKNFFELLGLSVIESGKGLIEAEAVSWLEKTGARARAIVAADADHPNLKFMCPAGGRLYLAGKTPNDRMINVFAGMDVYSALHDLLEWGESL